LSPRSFLEKTETKKQIIHINEEVSPRFEISSIIKRFDHNGPVIFFDKIRGHNNKVVANVCGPEKDYATLYPFRHSSCILG